MPADEVSHSSFWLPRAWFGTTRGVVLPNDAGTLNGGPFFNGFDTRAAMAQRFACQGYFATVTPACVPAAAGRPNQLYNLDSSFRGARSARFYVRFAF